MSVASLANTTISIERKTTTRDATGGEIKTWALHLRLKARLQPLRGWERLQYSRETESVTHKAYLPGAPDITHKDRATIGTRVFIIRAVRNTDELDHHTVLELEEQT